MLQNWCSKVKKTFDSLAGKVILSLDLPVSGVMSLQYSPRLETFQVQGWQASELSRKSGKSISKVVINCETTYQFDRMFILNPRVELWLFCRCFVVVLQFFGVVYL